MSLKLAERLLTKTLPLLVLSVAHLLAGRASSQMPPATQLQSSGGNYLLHAGDDLEITFFYNPELNQHAAVRPDGRISMPLIGDVQAEGLTVPKLTEVLEAAYNPELKRSNLSIQLRATPNQVYYVGGEVTRPGVLPLRGATVTALQAIIEAGGLKDSAAQGGISILRRSPSGAIELHTIALKSKKGVISESAQFELQPLDVLIVSETRINKLDRMMEQYVKRLSPVLMTGGFTYLFGSTTTVP